MKTFIRSLLLLSLLSAAPLTTWAQSQCVQLFAKATAISNIRELDVPVYDVTYQGKKVPSVLVNEQSYAKIQPLLQKTLGIVVIHQTGYNNDHGMMRLGDYFIDRDLPGNRARGEINSTGISWANVGEYVEYAERSQSQYNRIEVLFDLTDAEYNTAVTYQKMLRAGIVRPDFNFGQDTNPKDVNNRLASGGEICFSFSCGSSTFYQISEMQKKISALGVADVNAFLKSDEVKTFLKESKEYILNADLSANKLNPDLVLNVPSSIAVAKVLGIKVPVSNLIRLKQMVGVVTPNPELSSALNWILGLSLTSEYSELLKTLSISNSSSYSNISSPRASAILVYDSTVSPAVFQTPAYKSVGVFSTWSHN